MEKLYKKLESYGQSDYYPFHMPGHKRNPDSVRGDFPFERDITEIEGFDNLHHPEDILLEAQKNVSKLYGTKESYYSVNGSTAALLAAVSAAVPRKGQILVARNCHKAVYHAMYLRELKPTYIYPQMDMKWWINGGIFPDKVERCLAENPEITEKGEDYETFKAALNYINTTLAKKIAGDGEGATALFEVKIIGAESKEQAVTLSKSVVTSSLTKAAIYGHDANWGRILCAMGYSGAKFDPEKVDLFFESKAGKIQIIENGVAVDYSEEEATKILSEEAVTAIADVKMGDATATAWGCDLTYDYIKINADYRS